MLAGVRHIHLVERLEHVFKVLLFDSDAGMPDAILNAKQVTEVTGLSRTTIWRLEKDDKFPKRLQLSPSRVGWSKEEVTVWMETLKATRDHDEAALVTVFGACVHSNPNAHNQSV
ncbi:MAG: helix-turn-helix transcriptional regulator [Gammaproteobacteria bacterium]